MNEHEKTTFGSGFERYEKGKIVSEKDNADYNKERGEEAGHFNYLKDKLRKLKEGGSDIHFGQIDVDNLSEKAIDFYRLFEKGLMDEKKLEEYTSQFSPGDNEYQFAALLRNWVLEKKELQAEKEKELLKEEAERQMVKLKEKNPHISAQVENINLDLLRRADLKIIQDLNPHSLGEYEKNLRDYFRNKTQNKKEDELAIIKNDPRFRYYQALRQVLDLDPGSPDIFINN